MIQTAYPALKLGTIMADTNGALALGNRKPTRLARSAHSLTSDSPASMIQRILSSMFGRAPANVDRFCQITKQEALQIVYIAANEPLGALLSDRPIDQILPVGVPARHPPDRADAVVGFGDLSSFYTNLNLDGSWEQVDPQEGDLFEVIVIGYNEVRHLALYWCERIP